MDPDIVLTRPESMFFLSRLTNWFRARRRNVFVFFDGTVNRRVDPIAVTDRLEESCPDYVVLLESLSKRTDQVPPGPVREELVLSQKKAVKELVKAARFAFDLKPLDQTGGATDGECVAVLTRFFLFMEMIAVRARIFL